MATYAKSQTEREVIIETLRQRYGIKPGDAIYSCSPAPTGHVEFLTISSVPGYPGEQEIVNITGLVARLLGLRRSRYGGLTGAPSEIIYELGAALFGHGEQARALGYVSGRNGSHEPEDNGGFMLRHYRL